MPPSPMDAYEGPVPRVVVYDHDGTLLEQLLYAGRLDITIGFGIRLESDGRPAPSATPWQRGHAADRPARSQEGGVVDGHRSPIIEEVHTDNSDDDSSRPDGCGMDAVDDILQGISSMNMMTEPFAGHMYPTQPGKPFHFSYDLITSCVTPCWGFCLGTPSHSGHGRDGHDVHNNKNNKNNKTGKGASNRRRHRGRGGRNNTGARSFVGGGKE